MGEPLWQKLPVPNVLSLQSMPSDTIWYLTLDSQRLQKADVFDGLHDLQQYDFDFFSYQVPLSSMDVVSSVTAKSLNVYFGKSSGVSGMTENISCATQCLEEAPRKSGSLSRRSCACSISAATHELNFRGAANISRLVRCQIVELRDCVSWLIWQTLEGMRAIPRDSLLLRDVGNVAGACRRELELSLRACNEDLVEYLLTAVYYVAMAFRLLDPEELFDVVTESVTGDVSSPTTHKHWPERFPRSSQDLMNLCSRVLTV